MTYIPDLTERYPAGFNASDTDYEAEERFDEYLSQNKMKLDKAYETGNAVDFSDNCYGCPYYEDVGPTWKYYDDIDDVCHGICNRKDIKDCVYRKEK